MEIKYIQYKEETIDFRSSYITSSILAASCDLCGEKIYLNDFYWRSKHPVLRPYIYNFDYFFRIHKHCLEELEKDPVEVLFKLKLGIV